MNHITPLNPFVAGVLLYLSFLPRQGLSQTASKPLSIARGPCVCDKWEQQSDL